MLSVFYMQLLEKNLIRVFRRLGFLLSKFSEFLFNGPFDGQLYVMVISRKLSIMSDIGGSEARSAEDSPISDIIGSLRLITYLKHFTVFDYLFITF